MGQVSTSLIPVTINSNYKLFEHCDELYICKE